jgi:hypothetical protein
MGTSISSRLHPSLAAVASTSFLMCLACSSGNNSSGGNSSATGGTSDTSSTSVGNTGGFKNGGGNTNNNNGGNNSTGGTSGPNDTGSNPNQTGTSVVNPGTCAEPPADRSSLSSPLASCTRTVPEDVASSIQCSADTAKPANCTAHQPCGAVTGCLLERNEAIVSMVQTTYVAGPSSYQPPAAPAWPGSVPIAPMGTWMHGAATGWFARPLTNEPQLVSGTDQPGSCGFPPSRDLMIVAISSKQFGIENNLGADKDGVYSYAYWCGACAELVGRSGRRVRVQVHTQCTGCPDNHIDLPASSEQDTRNDTPFAMIDDPQDGNNVCEGGSQPVDWRIVPCETCGGIVLSYPDGFDRFTPAFFVDNHRIPIVKAEVKTGGSWVQVQRTSNNWFYPTRATSEINSSMEVRVIAIDGATITGAFPAYEAGKSYEASNQF